MYDTGRRRGKWLALLAVLILAAGYCMWSARRPLPAVPAAEPSVKAQAAVPAAKPLSWPGGGQAAVGIAGSSILETHNKQKAMPTASTAKLITVLSILRQRPLTLGQQGPDIKLTAEDVRIYNAYAAQQGSVVPVKAGEKISEYQALQTILLPSADNMADSLAIWAFGSLKAYETYANGYVAGLGLTDTHVGSDASGFSPTTVSSAHDLTKIGGIVMSNPVLAQIAGQKEVGGIPIAGTIRNVDSLLGTGGIVGVKTGNTDQAGGVFVGAARPTVNGRQVTVVTAVMHLEDLSSALRSSLPLIQSAQSHFKQVTVVKAGTVVGRYSLPWGGSISAIAGQDLTLSGWAGSNLPFTVKLQPISPSIAKSGQTVGVLTLGKTALNDRQTIVIKLRDAPTKPSFIWRLLHPSK